MSMNYHSAAAPNVSLEERIAQTGAELGRTIGAVVGALPGHPTATMAVARALGIDKVLASRVLKAVRFPDPIAVVHHIPGPEPLRRLLKAATRQVDKQLVAEAHAAVDAFEALVRNEAGDRSSLDAMISGWLPEVRHHFELSRKQAAFKAMSQLRGAAAATNVWAAFIQPSDDGTTLDVAWVYGLVGLQRLRAGVPVKFANRRISRDPVAARQVRTLAGEPAESLEGLRLAPFCSQPPPRLEAATVGDAVHYVLAGSGFGSGSEIDVVFADLTLHEMRRFSRPERRRKPYIFAEVATPSKALVFDVFLHEDVYPGSTPELQVYDTAIDGLADFNDPVRYVDRLDFHESIQPLGRGIDQCRLHQYPRYPALLQHVFQKLEWTPARFRGYRCNIEYPIYGSQVVMAFEAPPAPE